LEQPVLRPLAFLKVALLLTTSLLLAAAVLTTSEAEVAVRAVFYLGLQA
jgi:hypothetical protein